MIFYQYILEKNKKWITFVRILLIPPPHTHKLLFSKSKIYGAADVQK